MAESSSASAAPTAEHDKRSREQVDERLAQQAATHHARITLGCQPLDYQAHAAYVPVVASGFDGAHAQPETTVFTTASTSTPQCVVGCSTTTMTPAT